MGGSSLDLVWRGHYHDGSEMARILSDADTKSLPRPLVKTVRLRHPGGSDYERSASKKYPVKYPSISDDRNLLHVFPEDCSE